ncbi:MAG: hypothetical protein KC457_30810, partial [Myxococcales bacterium]|nr:hypothetical protein [Myxococcales bacterium]
QAATLGLLLLSPEADTATSLPRYDAPATAPTEPETPTTPDDATPPPLRKVPGTGNAQLAIAGLSIGGGVTSLVSAGLMIRSGATDDWRLQPEDWRAPLALGIVGVAAGTVLLATGLRSRRRYRDWASQQPDREQIPASGSGMIASGTMLIVAGATAGPAGTVLTAFDCEQTYVICQRAPIGPLLLGGALTSLAVGSGLMIAGMKRHERHKRWRRETAPQAIVLPSFGPTIGGAQVGLVGRF